MQLQSNTSGDSCVLGFVVELALPQPGSRCDNPSCHNPVSVLCVVNPRFCIVRCEPAFLCCALRTCVLNAASCVAHCGAAKAFRQSREQTDCRSEDFLDKLRARLLQRALAEQAKLEHAGKEPREYSLLVQAQARGKILHTKSHKHDNPLEHATENPLDNSSKNPRDK